MAKRSKEEQRRAKKSKEERGGAKKGSRRAKVGTRILVKGAERLGKAIKGRKEGDMKSATVYKLVQGNRVHTRMYFTSIRNASLIIFSHA